MPWEIASVLSPFAVKFVGGGAFGIGIFVVVNLVVEIILVLVGNVVFSVVCGLVVGGKVVCWVVWERLLGTSLPLVHCLFKRIIFK